MTIPPINYQPLVDLLSHTGELTTEWKAFRSASLLGKVVLLVSALIALCGLLGSVFPNSRIAILVGSIGAALGIVAHVIAAVHYSAGRQNLKANAQSVLAAVQIAAGEGAALLAPAAPAAPVTVNVHPAPVQGPPAP